MYGRKRKYNSADEDSDSVVELVNGNHILFFGDVTNGTFAKLRAILLRLEKPKKVYLHINSHGGDAYAGVGMFDVIRNLEYPTVSIIEGVCHSAATLISLACDESYMTKHSSIMIHQLWNSFQGTLEQHRVDLYNSALLTDRYIQIYKARTRMSQAQIKKELQEDTEMNIQEACKFGFVRGEWPVPVDA